MSADFVSDHAWIPITVAAALMQTLRTALQKSLAGDLSANASTLARYLYGLPIALIYLAAIRAASDAPPVHFTATFAVNILIGGLAQIIATVLLIKALTARSYAVGIALSKTEAVQAAVLAVIVLGEQVSAAGAVALVVSAAGVMTMSAPGQTWSLRFDRAAVYGLVSGTMFGITAVGIRAANLALGTGFALAAAYTLAVMVSLQTAILVGYIALTQPDQLRGLARNWTPALGVGVFSALGSIGWFTGMALEKAAYVRTLGQVELVFTVLASRFYFRETLRGRELAGMVLIVAGILILVLTG